jgi:signal peptidase II
VNGTEERAVNRRFGGIWMAAVIVVVDQITKAIVRQRFELHESVVVIPNFFDLTRVHNTGAAFGMLNNSDFPFKSVVLVLVAFAALAGVAMYAAMLPPAQWLARIGLAFILGGAAGNLIDRVMLGYVVDFFDFYWRGWHFWAFNVADAAITVGVGLMILDLLGLGTRRVSRTV